MRIGMIGLGRMGANMSERLLRAGHEVVGFDQDPNARRKLREAAGEDVESLEALVEALRPPRVAWIMVPAGRPVDSTLEVLVPLLTRGDTIVDGGNSYYRETMRRAAGLREAGLQFVDVGTSGGIWGLREGYSLMIGGDGDAVSPLRPIFEALAPAMDAGWGHVGPSGAGHFAKMIHNGIEYGLMQAYAEGFAILDAKKEFDLDTGQMAEIWRYGSVIRSWLLDLSAVALHENPELSGIAPYVQDSGEGRWTVAEAIDLNVAAPVITLSLQARLRSRESNSFADRLLAVLRRQFGGHPVRPVD